MKVLVYGLNHAPEAVGIGKYTHEMCAWLASRGHRVKVVTGYPSYPDWKIQPPYRNTRYGNEQRDGVEIIRCPLYIPSSPTSKRRLAHYLSFAMSSSPAAIGHALRFRPDVVLAVAPSLLVAPAAVLAARLTGARSWLHIQDFEVEAAFQLGITSGNRLRSGAEFIERMLFARFDRVSTVSAKMIDRLVSKHVPRARTVEFRNWVDTSLIKPQDRLGSFRNDLGLASETIVALYSGSMALKQGLGTLVDAARLLESKRPEITMVLCGNGATREDLIRRSAGLRNVRFLNLQPQERLSELLSIADVHLLPQRTEVADLVLPSKLGAILASGRPVVAMAEPGTQLAAEVEGSGLSIPAGDPAALAAALVQLADDRARREQLGAAARLASQARWDMHTILAGVEDSLLALTSNSAQSAPLGAQAQQRG
jgi:colanic acid biosynthesis glycosyl transferase WcaI